MEENICITYNRGLLYKIHKIYLKSLRKRYLIKKWAEDISSYITDVETGMAKYHMERCSELLGKMAE